MVRRGLQTVRRLRSFTGALTVSWASYEIPRKFQVYSWERAKLCSILSTHLSIAHCSFNIVSETTQVKEILFLHREHLLHMVVMFQFLCSAGKKLQPDATMKDVFLFPCSPVLFVSLAGFIKMAGSSRPSSATLINSRAVYAS